MVKINPEGDIHILLATDNNYAPHVKVTINSLLCNCNPGYSYDIVILCVDVENEHKELISNLTKKHENAKIRFFDVKEYIKEWGNLTINGYLTLATYFRLLIFSELFDNYEKLVYLDSDVIVEGDISNLFFTDMENKPLAAVEELGFRQLSFSKKAVFLDQNKPFNIDNYKMYGIGMKNPKEYFNAGVMLFDLVKCRKSIHIENVKEILSKHVYYYNDQDVLNILFDGKVKLIDPEWNYENCVDAFLSKRPEVYGSIFEDVKRMSPKIIHYVSARKPWNCDVALDEYFHKYE